MTFTKKHVFIPFIVLTLTILLTQCGGTTTGSASNSDTSSESLVGTTPDETEQQLAAMMLPMMSSSMSLVSPSSSTTSANLGAEIMHSLAHPENPYLDLSIGAWNAGSGFPATPLDMISDNTFQVAMNNANCGPSSASTDVVARYPATGYLEDFYSVNGYQACMILSETTDGWGDYQVALYVYPTLSSEVSYTVEKYRVPEDDWTFFVDQNTGDYSALAFEEVSTHYFDGRIETRTIEETRYNAGVVYDESDFPFPTNLTDSAYDYPNSITEPDTRATNDVGGNEEYSEHSTYSVTSPLSWVCFFSSCSTESGEEFYTKVLDSNGDFTTHSVAYNVITTTNPVRGLNITTHKVTRYTVHPSGFIITRSKASNTYILNSKRYTQNITDETRTHDDDGDGLNNFSQRKITEDQNSNITGKNLKIYTYTYIYNLEATDSSNSSYTGQASYTTTQGSSVKHYLYNVTVDASNGVVMTYLGRISSPLNFSLASNTEASPTISEEQDITQSFVTDNHYDYESDNDAEVSFDQVWTMTAGQLEYKKFGNLAVGEFTHIDGTSLNVLMGDGFSFFWDP